MKTTFWNQTIFLLIGMIACLASCHEGGEEIELKAPMITLDNQTALYSVKVGKTITIKPTYQNAEAATYAWKMDGKIISNSPQLDYEANELGDKFLSLEVTNSVGSAYVEMKITVVSLLLPQISIAIPEKGFFLVKGGELAFSPVVENAEGATYAWTLGDKTLASTKNFTFHGDETGDFTLVFKAINEDGTAQASVPVKVCNPEDMPFLWAFEQTTYNLSVGRKIRICVWDVANVANAEFTWMVNGIEKQKSSQPVFIFDGTDKGTFQVVVTLSNTLVSQSQSLIVNVCEPEGTYKRAVSGTSSPQWNKVYEFLPAPGQFINDGYTATTMAEAVNYAEGKLKTNLPVSLGGFGGYIIVGFDHSIENDGSYNLQIKGNPFAGSSEPGVVWVMQDENGNGLPDDTWYELKGSEYGKPEEYRDYAVTYYKPQASGMPVQWTDSRGQSGTIDYLGFHSQDYYYPNWVTANSYTLRGTCLPSHTQETSPGYWENGGWEWGYADNYSPVDRLDTNGNFSATSNDNHFRISDAVTFDGQPANLKYIDFVKIVTGVNEKAGWLGEVSTEVCHVKDFNLLKNNK